jgi:hypothetical protein
MGASCGRTNPQKVNDIVKTTRPPLTLEDHLIKDRLSHNDDSKQKIIIPSSNDSEQELITMKQLNAILNEIDKLCTDFHKLYLLLDIPGLIHLCMRAKNEKEDYKDLITKTIQKMQDFDKMDLNVIVDALSRVRHIIVTQNKSNSHLKSVYNIIQITGFNRCIYF